LNRLEGKKKRDQRNFDPVKTEENSNYED